MSKHWRVIVLGIIVSGASIVLIVSQINDLSLLVTAMQTALTGRGLLIFLITSLLTGVGLFMRSIRWRVLLSGGLTRWRAFHILNVAYLINGLLPFRIGEMARAWLASRGEQAVPIFQSAGTIVLERILDLLMVVLFIAVGLAAAGEAVPSQLRATGAFMGAAALVGFFTLIFLAGRRALAQTILEWVLKRFPPLQRLNLTGWLNQFLDGLKPLTHLVSLLKVLGWTAISWAFSFVSGYLLMLIFYPQGDAITTLLFIASASFAVALPATAANLGTYELSILLVMVAMGYARTDDPSTMATATAFAITVHFMNLLVNAILGIVGFVTEGITLEQLVKQASSTEVLGKTQ
ncbi:MAG: flippase-like domain-containing protein [Anaerolineae bacterium]|nr:flippase-like domain-containing protein [Anaerolineae bacterium]